MPRLKKILAVVVLLYIVGLFIWYFASTTQAIREKQVVDYNQLQLSLARQVAGNVENYFGFLGHDLQTLSRSPDIIALTDHGMETLADFYRGRRQFLSAVTRIDEQGRIAFTFPQRPQLIGKSVLGQSHNAELFRTRQPQLSEVLTILQGYQAVVYAYPVFQKGRFKGALSLIISVRHISSRFFTPLLKTPQRQALVVSRSGGAVFRTPGLPSLDPVNDPASPLHDAFKKMLHQGSGTVSFSLSDQGSSVAQHGAFTSIALPSNSWHILVFTPKSRVLLGLNDLRKQWIWFLVLFGLGLLTLAYLLLDAFVISGVQRKKLETEQALAQSQQDFQAVLEHLPLGLLVVEDDGVISYQNQYLTRLRGAAAPSRQQLADFISDVAPDRARQKTWQRQLLGTADASTLPPEPLPLFEAELLAAEEHSPCIVSVSQSTMAGRRIIAIEDITARKRDESSRQELQLSTQRSHKMEAIGLMAGGVAHDLNNLLAGVVSYPDMLLHSAAPDSPLREPLQVILNSGQQAADMVADLLAATRGVSSFRVNCNLVEIVNEYLSSPTQAALCRAHPQTRFTVDVEPAALFIHGSPIHLLKSLMNLCSNAFEALEGAPGRVTVSVTTADRSEPTHGFELIPPGSWVVLAVADTGSGISAEQRERIFEPFYTRKVMGRSGTGLGLSIVWHTVRDNDGFIDLESGPDGTRFSLYFPWVEEAAPEPVTDAEPGELAGAGRRVLVIDDDETQRTVTRRALSNLGFDVTTVSSGEAGVRMVGDREFELLLLDMLMEPGIDGLETYRRIHALCPALPTLIVSGYAQSSSIEEALALGVDGTLAKPWTVDDLQAAIGPLLTPPPPTGQPQPESTD